MLLKMDRKFILYIAASLDGYIAQPDDRLDFLSLVEKEGEDYGYSEFIQSVDTVIMGRRTYDWVMAQVPEFPHAALESYIITRSYRPPIGKTVFYTGDLSSLVMELKSRAGGHIFIDGGAEIVHQFLLGQWIDEIILSVIPILTGSGLPLFKEGRPEQQLTLCASKVFDTGLVQLHYRMNKKSIDL